jgi:nondiscriminating aspartyl-tRNA synthetase
MKRTHYSNQVTPKLDGKQATVAGWVHDLRDLGGIKFVRLRDRYGFVQVTVLKKNVSKDTLELVSKLTDESVISVSGKVQANKEAPGGVEILPDKMELLALAETPLLMDISGKIESDLDTRLDSRFMDLRKKDIQAIFMLKDIFLTGVRNSLEAQGFVEVHTPKIVSAGAEGGATLFQIKYFNREAYLNQSPQLYKQIMMATGLDRVYEIAPAFRAEKSDTTRHLAEFTSFDIEMAFIDSQEEVFTVTENILVDTFKHINQAGKPWLRILNKKVLVPKTPFPRITYTEALKKLEKEGAKRIDFGHDLDTEAEKLLGKIMKTDFFFVKGYPSEEKPFYIMRHDGNPELSHSFDLIYRGQELASGGQREHRVAELVKNLKSRNLDPEDFTSYVNAFRFGMPPHGGFGFGIERFVEQMLDLKNVREVVLFPRDLKRLEP